MVAACEATGGRLVVVAGRVAGVARGGAAAAGGGSLQVKTPTVKFAPGEENLGGHQVAKLPLIEWSS